MKIEISTDGYKIVSSGSVFLFDSDSEIRLHVIASDNFKFNIVMRFDKSEVSESSINKEVKENTITFTCYGFNSSLGTGTVEPLSIATIAEKELLLHFWVYLMGTSQKSARKIEYTFLEKE